MPGPVEQGTFSATQTQTSPLTSDVVDVPYNVTTMKLTTLGLDGSNTLKTQKSVGSNGAWADQVTYNSDQTNTAITVVPGEQWRVQLITEAAVKDILYKLSCES